MRIWQPEQPVFTDSGKLIDYGWIANVGARVLGYDGYRYDKRLNPTFTVKGTYKMPFLKGLSASIQYNTGSKLARVTCRPELVSHISRESFSKTIHAVIKPF